MNLNQVFVKSYNMSSFGTKIKWMSLDPQPKLIKRVN